jgi:hypothetical protein
MNSGSEGFKTPSIKVLSNDIGLTSAKVTKIINQLYEDLWALNLDQPKLFIPDSEFCTFYFKDGFNLYQHSKWHNKRYRCMMI